MNVRNIKLGAYGGLAGGVIFSAIMASLAVLLPLVGMLIGHRSAIITFLVYLMLSLLAGASFLSFFQHFLRRANSELGYGLIYGGTWWFLGPLTLMPLLMGTGVEWNVAAVPQVMYGALLGFGYAWLGNQAIRRQRAPLASLRPAEGH